MWFFCKEKKEVKEVPVLVEISAKHIHLSKKDLEELFGKGYELKSVKTLSQPGEYLAKETVDLVYGNKRLHNVSIVGPPRKKSQVEFSLSDCYSLGMDPLPKIKLSGDTFGTVKIKAEGTKGSVKVPCIIPKRHLHLPKGRAKKLGIKDYQKIDVKIPGEREIVFKDVIVRTSKDYKSAIHLDTDEGNAAGIKEGKGDGKLLLKSEKEEDKEESSKKKTNKKSSSKKKNSKG